MHSMIDPRTPKQDGDNLGLFAMIPWHLLDCPLFQF
jgi:hypothetical protein